MGRLKGLRTLLLGAMAMALFLYLYSLSNQPAPLPSPRDVYRGTPVTTLGIYEPVRIVSSRENAIEYALTLVDKSDTTIELVCDRVESNRLTIITDAGGEEGTRQPVTRPLARSGEEQEACYGLLIRLEESSPGHRLDHPALTRILVVLESYYRNHLVRELYRAESLDALQLTEPTTRVQVAAADPIYGVSIQDETGQTLDACVSFAEESPRIFLGTQLPSSQAGWEVGMTDAATASLYAVLIRWNRRHDSPRARELLERLDRAFVLRHGR